MQSYRKHTNLSPYRKTLHYPVSESRFPALTARTLPTHRVSFLRLAFQRRVPIPPARGQNPGILWLEHVLPFRLSCLCE